MEESKSEWNFLSNSEKSDHIDLDAAEKKKVFFATNTDDEAILDYFEEKAHDKRQAIMNNISQNEGLYRQVRQSTKIHLHNLCNLKIIGR